MLTVKFIENENKYFVVVNHSSGEEYEYELCCRFNNIDKSKSINYEKNLIDILCIEDKQYFKNNEKYFKVKFNINSTKFDEFSNDTVIIYFTVEVIFNDLQSEILYKLKS